MDRFESNRKRLAEIQPALAIELGWAGAVSDRDSLSGELPNVDSLIVRGLAVAPVLNWLDRDGARQAYFLEFDLGRLRALFSREEGERLLHHPRAHLVRSLPKGIGVSVEVVAADRCQDEITGLQQELLLSCTSELTWEKEDREQVLSNILCNLPQLHTAHLATDLWGRFKGIPAIVCGAGPSLDRQLAQLGELRDRALILAGGSALTACTRAGIDPHLGAGIDPTDTHCDRMLMGSGFETPLFYRQRINPQVLASWHGPKLYVSGAAGYPLVDWIDQRMGLGVSEVREGPSVSTFLLSIAEQMGCGPIYLVGMDLCLQEGNEYAEAVGVQRSPDGVEFAGRKTLPHWVVEAAWISQWAQEKRVINTTPAGLPIPGVEIGDLEVGDPPRDLEGEVRAAVQASRQIGDEVLDLLEELQASLARTHELLGVIESNPGSGEALIAEVELEDEVAYHRIIHHG